LKPWVRSSADRLVDGVMVFSTVEAEARARAHAKELRRLADIDEERG
jgi:hypothetical protein